MLKVSLLLLVRRSLGVGGLSLALAAMATAQNLVPNPSFEDTAYCNMYDPVRTPAPPWFNPNIATPDIYDCDLDRQCGVVWDPSNLDVQLSGWQYAHTGTRFAGGYHWYGPNSSDSKDYFMAPLFQPMLPGASYAVSLYYSRADGFYWATDRISVYFGPDSIHVQDPGTLSLVPQIDLMDPLHPYLENATDWVQLTDTFVATGGEAYMIIGSFLDSSQVNGIQTTGTFHYCYYYYDDVSVVALSVPETVHELLFSEAQQWPDIDLIWNGRDVVHIRLYDASGRLIGSMDREMNSGVNTLQFNGDAAPGMYVMVVDNGKERRIGRLVMEDGGP